MAAKRISSRLKVYTTRIGVRDWLVAAESQKAALKAWDVHKNLFESGDARVINEPALVSLALKTPGLPVAAPGQLRIPETSNVVKLSSYRREPPPAPKRPPSPKPDRSKLDAAEKALAEFERDAGRQRAELDRRMRALALESETLDGDVKRRRERLAKRVKREEAALE